jgi:1,4-alpha-glucan branching enzyme
MPTAPLTRKVVLDQDGYLEPNVDALLNRHASFAKWKGTIEEHEGGYENFMKGYLKFGLNVASNGAVVYREWAPNAVQANVIGDFSRVSFLLIIVRHNSDYHDFFNIIRRMEQTVTPDEEG